VTASAISRNRVLRFGAAILAAVAASGAAGAEPSRFYVGAGIGRSSTTFNDCSNTIAGVQVCDIEDTDTGWKVFGGYKLEDRDLALEVSRVDLGTFRATAWGTFQTATSIYKVSGFSLDAVMTWPPRSRFGVIGRVGLFAWTLDASGTASGFGGYSSSSETTTRANIDYGLGLKYDFHPDLGVRAEFQRFVRVGTDATGKSDIDLVSASLVYRFR